MKKRVCGIITMCAFLCISPVNASATSFDNINEMLNKINGEDGFVEDRKSTRLNSSHT